MRVPTRRRAALAAFAATVAITVATVPSASAISTDTYTAPDSTVSLGAVDSSGAYTDAGTPAPDEGTTAEMQDSFVPKIGAVYDWSLETPGANGKRSAASTTAARTGENIPYAGWAACGAFDSRYKVVHDYAREWADPRMERTYARLYCGLFDADGTESAFGYRHILDRHAGDWQRKADYINRNWRDLAGWAMKYTFSDPGAIYKQSERFCYQRKFYLYYGDTQVSSMRAVMYLGRTAVRIMTAYPTNSGTCNGTKIQ